MNATSLSIDTHGELTKFATVLDLHQVTDYGPLVTFNSIPEDGDGRTTYITFSKDDYEDLGSPQQITVTVEPGNTLPALTDDFPPSPEEPMEDGGLGGQEKDPAATK